MYGVKLRGGRGALAGQGHRVHHYGAEDDRAEFRGFPLLPRCAGRRRQKRRVRFALRGLGEMLHERLQLARKPLRRAAHVARLRAKPRHVCV